MTWFTATISLMPQHNKVLFHVFVFFSLVILYLSYCKYPGGDFTSKGILSSNKRKKIVVIRNCRVEQPVIFIFIDLEHCRASFLNGLENSHNSEAITTNDSQDPGRKHPNNSLYGQKFSVIQNVICWFAWQNFYQFEQGGSTHLTLSRVTQADDGERKKAEKA